MILDRNEIRNSIRNNQIGLDASKLDHSTYIESRNKYSNTLR